MAAGGGRLSGRPLPGWRVTPEGLELRVKAQPKSRRPGPQGWVAGVDGPRLRLGVAEAPEDGRANRALCALLAGLLHVAPSAIEVVQGATSREKTLRIAGDPAHLAEKLELLA